MTIKVITPCVVADTFGTAVANAVSYDVGNTMENEIEFQYAVNALGTLANNTVSLPQTGAQHQTAIVNWQDANNCAACLVRGGPGAIYSVTAVGGDITLYLNDGDQSVVIPANTATSFKSFMMDPNFATPTWFPLK